MLGLLVFVHELGHFLAARISGMEVKEFAFGFPPRIWSKKYKGTRYAINLFPIGGYVRILGEDEKSSDPNAFGNKRIRSRIFVIVAGVLMNFVLAFFCLMILFWCSYPPLVSKIESYNGKVISNSGGLFIESIEEGSLAQEHDIQQGDIIESVNNLKTPTVKEIKDAVAEKVNGSIILEIKRGDESISKNIEIKGKDRLGVGLWEKMPKVKYTWWKVPYYAALETARTTYHATVAILGFFKNLIFDQKIEADVVGPVGLFGITSSAVKLGFGYILTLTILLTINLGIINILPFPALDGGRLVFLIVEKIRGKKVAESVEGVIHSIGFWLLIVLMILIAVRDIIKL